VARGGSDERALVDVEIELETHLEEETAFDDPRRNVGCPHRTQKNRIEVTQLVQRRVGENLAVAEVARTTEVEVGRVDVDSGGPDDLQCLDGDLGSDAVAADDCYAMCHRRAG